MSSVAMLEKVQHHLQEVSQNPTTQLDVRLLEHIDRQVSGPSAWGLILGCQR